MLPGYHQDQRHFYLFLLQKELQAGDDFVEYIFLLQAMCEPVGFMKNIISPACWGYLYFIRENITINRKFCLGVKCSYTHLTFEIADAVAPY